MNIIGFILDTGGANNAQEGGRDTERPEEFWIIPWTHGPRSHTRLLELIICYFLPLLVCFMRRLAPAVVYFCHSGNCPEPLAGLSLQLLALVGGVVWQRDGQRRGVMLLRPGHGHCVM